ncbi:MAG: hypothetical protein HWN66_06615 [Candidatus Helarchaeota archaeon]|nr:hypothetical protein [Candidatus Helarchaeota archaeon]
MLRWERFNVSELTTLGRRTRWALENNTIEFPDLTKVKTIEDIYTEDSIYFQIGNELLEELIHRMNESIEHAAQLSKGETEEIFVDYWALPPVVSITSNLQAGTTKLIYSANCDCSFVILDDFTGEVMAIWANHIEDGLIVDRYYIAPILDGNEEGWEIMNRRHLKIGERLRDIPKKRKLADAGQLIVDILKDIRNELHPEWSGGTFYACMACMFGAYNNITMKSNYEVLGSIWDGVNAPKLGYKDSWFIYVPLPPILNTLFALPRDIWIKRLTNLTTGGRFYIHQQSADMSTINKIFGRDAIFVPTPEQTIKAQPPKKGEDFKFPDTKEKVPRDVKGRQFLDEFNLTK